MSNPTASRTTEDRLEKIESALAHVQHDVDSLNASLLNQLRRLQEFEARFARLEHEMQMLHDPQERRDTGTDRPPHY